MRIKVKQEYCKELWIYVRSTVLQPIPPSGKIFTRLSSAVRNAFYPHGCLNGAGSMSLRYHAQHCDDPGLYRSVV
jgi:hypothetical protein